MSNKQQKKDTLLGNYIIAGLLVAFVLFMIIVGNCNKAPVNTEATIDSTALNDPATLNSPIIDTTPTIISNWDYSEETDPMTNKELYYATCTSPDTANFNSPYDGGSTLKIIIRKWNQGDEVMLKISNGQFISSYNGQVRIKFDDKEIHTYGYDDSSDGDSKYLFLHDASSIIARLKRATSIKVEPQFFQEGQTVFSFDVAGLKWKH